MPLVRIDVLTAVLYFPNVLSSIVMTNGSSATWSAIIGTAASGVDSFFFDRWLRGASPKFFIDSLKQVVKE